MAKRRSSFYRFVLPCNGRGGAGGGDELVGCREADFKVSLASNETPSTASSRARSTSLVSSVSVHVILAMSSLEVCVPVGFDNKSSAAGNKGG